MTFQFDKKPRGSTCSLRQLLFEFPFFSFQTFTKQVVKLFLISPRSLSVQLFTCSSHYVWKHVIFFSAQHLISIYIYKYSTFKATAAQVICCRTAPSSGQNMNPSNILVNY